MARLASFVSVVLALAGCGGDPVTPGTDAATSGTDAGTPGIDSAVPGIDAATPGSDAGHDAATPGADAGPLPDGGPTSCGTGAPVLTGSPATEGLAIARDGTIYYSRLGGVGRITPDGVRHDDWLGLTNASTVWGLALDADNTHLFVGVPGNGEVQVVTGLNGTPAHVHLANVDGPNGLTVGPDGGVYVSDFSNDVVVRLDPASGASTPVTASDIGGADGVAFTNSGTLLVTSYSAGTVLALTLDASHHETARSTVATAVPSADGIAIDENGVLYVGGGSRVYRIGSGGTPDMTLQMGHNGTANLEWGAGPLNCHDLYVATGTGLTRISLSVGERAVLWH